MSQSIRHEGRISFYLTKEQHDLLIQRQDDIHVLTLLRTLTECYSKHDFAEVMIRTIYTMSKSNEHYLKVATDAFNWVQSQQSLELQKEELKKA